MGRKRHVGKREVVIFNQVNIINFVIDINQNHHEIVKHAMNNGLHDVRESQTFHKASMKVKQRQRDK